MACCISSGRCFDCKVNWNIGKLFQFCFVRACLFAVGLVSLLIFFYLNFQNFHLTIGRMNVSHTDTHCMVLCTMTPLVDTLRFEFRCRRCRQVFRWRKQSSAAHKTTHYVLDDKQFPRFKQEFDNRPIRSKTRRCCVIRIQRWWQRILSERVINKTQDEDTKLKETQSMCNVQSATLILHIIS